MNPASTTPLVPLPYAIINPYKNFGEGNINSISNRQTGHWKSLIGTDKITIRCGLKNYCRVVSMEAQVMDVHLLEIVGYKDNRYQFEDMKLVSHKQKNGSVAIQLELKDKEALVDEIQIQISSFSKKQVSINFIIFLGYILEEKIAPKPSDPPLTMAQWNHKNHKTVLPIPTVDQAIIQELAHHNFGRSKTSKKTELCPESIKKKKKANEPLVMKKQIEVRDLKEQLEIDEGYEQNSEFHETVLVTKEELARLQNLSEEWILAQKRFEFRFRVPTSKQLTVKIAPLCLKGQQFCIANETGSEKTNLVAMIRQLGGTITAEPEHKCTIVTPAMKGSMIGIAKLMNGVKFVNPEYVRDCFRSKARLSTAKYCHETSSDLAYKVNSK